MYETLFARRHAVRTVAVVTVALSALSLAVQGVARADALDSPDLMYKITGRTDRLELTTNSSRILTLDKNIPRVQVNNPDLLAVTPLSANQVQISAKKAGVTQVNLWDDAGKIHTVDVLIYGDVRELEVALQTQFPNSSIRVYRYSESLVLKGFIDQPEQVSQVVALASDYAPKVINNITVGGVQQVLLKVKVMEVSRTKLRELGSDWAVIDGNNILAASNVSQLLASTGTILNTGGDLIKTGNTAGQTFQFGVFSGNLAFIGVLDALQQRNVAKILAEPNLVAVSGRPAQFNVGGEFPILVPQSLGTTSIEYKKYGTQIDFLPIVLGNGRIRLEVRPRITERDPTLSVEIQGTSVPALTLREVDTAVEMQAGQTFALAGLVQMRTESQVRGLPWVSDLPVIGFPFRKTEDRVNEIELLIMVTPEFVDAMEPWDVACCGPGMGTTSPMDCDLYCGGHIEVPAAANPFIGPTACGECGGPGACGGCGGCGNGCSNGSCGVNGGNYGPNGGPADSIISDGMPMNGGTGYDDSYGPSPMPLPSTSNPGDSGHGPAMQPNSVIIPPSSAEPLPEQSSSMSTAPSSKLVASQYASTPEYRTSPEYTVPRPYSPSRQPVFVRNATSPNNPNSETESTESSSAPGGLIGPIGYDAE